MDKDETMTVLPRGPWVSEEEMEAILATDADAEFERLMHRPRRRWLWWVAAACAAGVAAWPLLPKQETDLIAETLLAEADNAFAKADNDCREAMAATVVEDPQDNETIIYNL